MAVNLASKYSDKIDERFKQQSVTSAFTSGDYDWIGVQTVKIYSVNTVPLGSYTKSGTARYGTPAELSDNVQEKTLSQDQSFAMTIDKGNNADQMGIKASGKALKREIDEVIIPTLDKYRLATWANGAGNGAILSDAPTSATIVGLINTGAIALDNDNVPESGRALFIRATNFGQLRTSTEFLGLEGLGTKGVSKGMVGEIFGMPVIKVPDSYLPDCYFMIVHKSAVIAPAKLQEYKTHVDPPGINGVLIEGRVYHDAFVLGEKCNGIYVAGVTGSMCAAVTATYVGGSTDTITLASATAATTIKYTLDGTDPKFSTTALTYSSALDTSAWEAGTYTVKAYAEKATLISSLTSTTDIAVSAS